LVARYYWTIRSILKEKPHLKKYLTRCRHCGILFFTHPRNAGRSDLGCPFGCRQAHRRKNAIQRSTEYYQTKEGMEKKKHLNARRSSANHLPDLSCDENDDLDLLFDRTTVCHIQLVTGLVEGRFIDLAEVYALLKKILRQHSIDWKQKLFYGAGNYRKNSP